MCVFVFPLFDRDPHHLLSTPQLPLQRERERVCVSVGGVRTDMLTLVYVACPLSLPPSSSSLPAFAEYSASG